MTIGCISVYGRTRSWLGMKWHTAASDDSEFTFCGMRLPFDVGDNPPPPHDVRCGQCEKVVREIERLVEARRS